MEYQFGEFQLKNPSIWCEKELPESVTVNAVFIYEGQKDVERMILFVKLSMTLLF